MHTEGDFIQSIEQHQNIIHKVCKLYIDDSQDRQDLFQEIVLAAWKGYKNFRGDAKFSTWLYRVSLNTAITFYRKEKRQLPVTGLHEQLTSIADMKDNDDDQLTAMYNCINQLSKIDKALVMLYMEDFSYTEIGETMGITPNHVAVKLNRIKTKLKESVKKYLAN